ncbi:NAD(P)H-dependent oxidoreductase [Salininema proteolyticum]|uniref:NAD(P)H-dependent oxidoreductase n=1 Tax=Salininema proteolyticum TaxID=1607685 RepID=A0ABV8TSG7_9ACTN
MNVHIVLAHPSPTSLCASLCDEAVAFLTANGHEVTVSDLYAMKWKAVADYDDLGSHTDGTYIDASGEAYRDGGLSEDIRTEQARIEAADAVVLLFPLWWFSMPAIMKGWVDRVLVNGLGYGTTRGWKRYGDGAYAGKRGMVITAAGGSETVLSERGVSGSITDILWPINHGILYYTGMDVLEPHVVTSAVTVDSDRYQNLVAELRERLEGLETDEPIAYRSQAGGDYDERRRLKPGRERPGTSGFDLHIA